MSNPTTPFSWQMPTATDLVTDLPADFEVFGQAVATSMGDLLGGSSGYILSKASATDMDFTWIANDQGDITGVTAGNGISVTNPTGPVPTVAIDTAITVDKTTAQILTNKTLTTPIIASISNSGTLTLPTSTDTLVGRATTDTLTNKKLSDSTTTIVDVSDATKAIKFDVAGTTAVTGTIATAFTTAKTLTLPDATDTLVGKATTDTLTNKTLTSPALTTPTISTATTNGDLLYGTGSGALARLGIGSASQVLSVSAGIPAWSTPSSGSYTLIGRTTFSNVASVTISSVFSSTYKTYVVNIEHIHGETTSTQDLGFQLRYATTTQTTNYNSSAVYFANGTSATVTNVGATGASYFNLNNTLGNQDFAGSAATFTIQNVGQADEYALYYGQGTDYNSNSSYVYGGQAGTARTYTGIVFLPDTGNITGQISIYGLATA